MRAAARAAVALIAVCLGVAAAAPPHELQADGSHGWIKFWGDGTVRVSGRGTITIMNASRSQFDVKGSWSEVDQHADGATYKKFEGSLSSIGIGTHVELRGWDLSLYHKGPRGKIWCRGEGTLVLDGSEPKAWVDHPEKWLKVKYPD